MSFKKSQSVADFLFHRETSSDILLRRRYASERLAHCKTLYKRDLVGHFGCVNAIEFSNNGGDFLASGGDDRRVLLWNMQHAMSNRKEKPFIAMKGEHHSNIFSVAFDSHNTKIYSGGNDDQVLVHDMQTGDTRDVFLHEDAVYGLAVDPRDDNVYASACADGRVLLWDTRVSSHQEPFVLGNYTTAFHAVVYHPMEPCLIATANSKEGVALWDVRAPRTCLMRYGSSHTQQNAMSVRFNQSGTRMVALRRRLPPVVYNIQSSVAAVQFDHSGYYNSCTMKSCCFAGDRDQYVISGSDDFNLYMWRVPEEGDEKGWVPKAQIVMSGHRSIVNQVRYNPQTSLVASSGVEKVVKIWSPFCAPGMSDGDELPRKMFSHQQYINLVINTGTGTGLAHDYSTQSTGEDPRMIAFFDSLVQREVDRSFSDSDDSELSPDTLYMNFEVESDDSPQDTDSDASISSFQASLIRMSQVADDDDDDDSDDDSDSNVVLFFPSKKRKVERISSSDESDDSASKRSKDEKNQDRPGTSNNDQKNNHTKTDSQGHGTKRKSTHTSSEDSSSSDEEDSMRDLQDTRLKSRIMRRFASRHKKIKGRVARDNHPQANPHKFRRMQNQLDHDRMINLRQRWAYCKALKARMAKSNEEPRTVTRVPNEDNLDIIAEHLDRTASRESRTAISKLRRRVLLEESTQGSNRDTSQPGISFNTSNSTDNLDESKVSRLKSTKCSKCSQDSRQCSCTENVDHASRKRTHSVDDDNSHSASKSSKCALESNLPASTSSYSTGQSEFTVDRKVLDRQVLSHDASKSSHKSSKANHKTSKSGNNPSKSSHKTSQSPCNSSNSNSKSSTGAIKSSHNPSKSGHKSSHKSSHTSSKSSQNPYNSSNSQPSTSASKSSHNASKSSHNPDESCHSPSKSSNTTNVSISEQDEAIAQSIPYQFKSKRTRGGKRQYRSNSKDNHHSKKEYDSESD